MILPFEQHEDDALLDVVLISRARLARNISGEPFVNRANREEQIRIRDSIASALRGLPELGLHWFDPETAPSAEGQVLLERHLVSPKFLEPGPHRLAGYREDARLSVMINEEDHLRIQGYGLAGGLSLAWANAKGCERLLDEHLSFAFNEQLGYLTACPTNVGTGIRLSLMLHLPGISLIGGMDRMQHAADDLNLEMRGTSGEGSEAIGHLHQISNRRTLGVDEEDLLRFLEEDFLSRVVREERRARDTLLSTRREFLDDRVQRALAMLRHARLLGEREALDLLSELRLGIAVGLLTGVPLETASQLMQRVRSGHLTRSTGCTEEEPLRIQRADLVRRELGGDTPPSPPPAEST